MNMGWEMGNDIWNSIDGPTSIFLAWTSKAMMASLIVLIVIGIIISFFGLKLVRVLSAFAGLAIGAVIGIAAVSGLGVSGMAVPVIILACAIILAILCAVMRRFGAFILVFLEVAAVAVSLLWPRTWIIAGICGGVALLMAVFAAIKTDAVVTIVTGISGGMSVGMSAAALIGLNEKNWWIGYVISAVLALIGIWVQFMMQSRKIGKKEEVYSKQVREEVSRESEVERARLILEDDGDDSDDNYDDETGEENEDDITIISEDL